MDSFKALYARQKFNADMTNTQTIYAQAPAVSHYHAPGVSFAEIAPTPPVGYTLEQIEHSNNVILSMGYRAEMISAGIISNLPADTIELYADGVFRIKREEQGIYKQIPVFIQMDNFQ